LAVQRAVHGSEGSLPAAVAGLRAARTDWRARRDETRDTDAFPSRVALARVVELLAATLYPRRLGGYRGADAGEDGFVAAKLSAALTDLEREVGHELGYWQAENKADFEQNQASAIAALFAAALPEVRRLVDSDVEAAFLGDPAARSVDEVLVCYPGAVASLHHRLAHQLYALGAPIAARIVSELANERTGIDIHPGASIGPGFFVDHGTGVVVGETAVIGARVRLYQHVTLGARGALGTTLTSPRDRHARHPVVGDDAVIYAGATILGRVRVGARAIVGGNAWLLDDVPDDACVIQPSALVLDRRAADGLRDRLSRAGDA